MMEHFPTRGPETHKEVLSLEVCKQLAQGMLAKLDKFEIDNIKHDPFNRRSGKTFDSLRDLLPEEILSHYNGHGVTRGENVDQVAAVISLLSNHILKGDHGRLGGTGGWIPAYTSGGFLVVSEKDTSLMKRDQNRKPIFRTLGNHEITQKPVEGYEVAPFKLVVNKWFLQLIPELKNLFPNETILSVEELADVLKKENEEQKTLP